MAIIENLPPDSAYMRARIGEAAQWGPDAYLLATVIDLLRQANWQRGGGKGAKPQPIKRPDAKSAARRVEYVQRLTNLGLIKA